ncbi:sensor histidine kinase [Paenibacillus turpanensis]|uniref:sensor histidine kinase n=1 Tax=Paenibacillus turpanensis TaxID=2689078 RepID=UPI0014077A30|nr:HAMP domain-containing sensor histidine kinase [Paenibacillus turpanensis]
MIRTTLYVKVVLTFIAVVLLGLVSSFFITSSLYREYAMEIFQARIHEEVKIVSELFDRMEIEEREQYLRDRAKRDALSLYLYGPNADEIGRYGVVKPHSMTKDDIERVLKGKVVIRKESWFLEFSKISFGVPLSWGGETYALVVSPHDLPEVQNLDRAFQTLILLALGIGSVLIAVAASYLVKPLREITQATKQIAKGNYDIRLSAARKDELGVLSASFQEMAGDLKKIETMRQEFVSDVSHEIQSPLASISGFVSLLRSPELSEEERHHYLDVIDRESKRLSRLSDNLLKLASLDSEHHPFQAAAFSLDRQIRNAVIAAEPQWSAKSLDIQLELPKLIVQGDEDQLNQVWQNLLSNSIKFTNAEGTIRISAEAHIDGIVVRVSDTGVGMSEENRKRALERFYKGDKSRTREQPGNGLGLAIVKRIVELHGGEISIDSSPGHGTTVTVKIPSR